MRRLMMLAGAALALAAGGCIVARHGNHHHVYGPAVAIRAGHVHSDHCGHFMHRGQEVFHHPAFQEMVFHQVRDVVNGHVGVMNFIREDHHFGPADAAVDAGRLHNLDLFVQVMLH